MATYWSESDRINLTRRDVQILLALMVRPLSGHSIARQCEVDLGQSLGSISNGAIYPALSQLQHLHLVEKDDSRASAYGLTDIGCSYLRQELDEYRRLVKVAEERGLGENSEVETESPTDFGPLPYS